MDRSKGRSKGGGLMSVLAAGAVGASICGACAAAPRLPSSGPPLFVGFYDAWDQSDLPALPRQLQGLEVFSPRWLTIRGAQGQVVVEPDNGAGVPAQRAAPRLKLMPLVSNAHDDIWDQAAVDAVMLDPAGRKALLARLVQIAQARGFSGYVFDFENLSPKAEAAWPAWLAAARQAFAAAGLEAWATVAPGPAEPFRSLAGAGDAAVLMAYDECWATSNAGPVAGADWLRQLLADRMQGVDPHHAVIALAAYGYDWPNGRAGQPIGAADAMRLAVRMKAPLIRDPASQNLHFAYTASDGRAHQVWFLDAKAFAADRAVAAAWRPRGFAIWRLGLEDPAVWSLPHTLGPQTARGTAGGVYPHPCDLLKPKAP